MSRRFIFAMLGLLVGLSVMISPVVAQVAFGQAGCGIAELATMPAHASGGHMTHADHGLSGHISAENEGKTCCDMVCSVDLPVQIGERPTTLREATLPLAWDSRSPVKQAGPHGLRRPPKV